MMKKMEKFSKEVGDRKKNQKNDTITELKS